MCHAFSEESSVFLLVDFSKLAIFLSFAHNSYKRCLVQYVFVKLFMLFFVFQIHAIVLGDALYAKPDEHN